VHRHIRNHTQSQFVYGPDHGRLQRISGHVHANLDRTPSCSRYRRCGISTRVECDGFRDAMDRRRQEKDARKAAASTPTRKLSSASAAGK
jgi:hypothetical protein